MARFDGRIHVMDWGSDEWVLTRPLTYFTNVLNKFTALPITAPRGFVNDLASIPRLFQSLIPKIGKHRYAAVTHDWMYYKQGHIGNLRLSRKQADKIFLEGMKVAGVKWIRRHAMYQAVRAGGWRYWNLKDKPNRMIDEITLAALES